MCGIGGVADLHGPVQERELAALAAALRHRGPDDEGIETGATASFSFGLVNRRLSIIDPSPAGHQPMGDPQTGCLLTYNGEVYNFPELRQELQSLGHPFHSRTDTEVVLRALVAWGPAALSRFNGIFALAFLDARDGSLLLARDRMGVKPLCYRWDGGRLVFASEARALAAAGLVAPAIDRAALNVYLTFGCVVAPHCLLAGVEKLEPGHFLRLAFRGLEGPRAFARLLPQPRPFRERDLVEETRSAVEAAVRRQLVADVPVGVMLSGGIDSGLLAILAQRFSGQRLHTFSVGYGEPATAHRDVREQNEDLAFAGRLAQRLGTEHHELRLSPADFIGRYRRLLTRIDEPSYEPVIVAQHELCRMAREAGVPVMLTGDGPDELFAGYPFYTIARRGEQLARVPLLRRALLRYAALRRTRGAWFWHHFGLQPQGSHSERLARVRSYFSGEERARLLQGAPVEDQLPNIYAAALEGTEGLEWTHAFSHADTLLRLRYLYDGRLDCDSMLASVEARVPYQDNAVVDLALQIPLPQKLGKRPLRLAFGDLIGQEILGRRKRGFNLPVQGWQDAGLARFARQVLAPEGVRRLDCLDPAATAEMLEQGLTNPARTLSLWVLISFQLWARGLLDGA